MVNNLETKLIFGQIPAKEASRRKKEANQEAARNPHQESQGSGYYLSSLFGDKLPQPPKQVKSPSWLQEKIRRNEKVREEARKAALGIKQPSIFPEETPLCLDHNQPMKSYTDSSRGKPRRIWYCPDCPRD